VITVDTTPPVPPVITGPPTDKPINDPQVPITGTGEEEGNKITVEDEDGNVICETVVEADLTWTCIPDDPLDEGSHTLVAKEEDKAGNVSNPSDPIDVVIKTTPPDAPIITGPAGGTTPIKDPKPPITGSGEEEGNVIEVFDGTKKICETTVKADLTWECILDDPLDDGDHTITAKETDKAGNVSSPSAPKYVKIRTVPPSKPMVDDTNGSLITGLADTDSTVTVYDEHGVAIPGCIDLIPSTEDPVGVFSCTPRTRLLPGAEIEVIATDEAGNDSEPENALIRALEIEIANENAQPGDSQVVTGYHFNPGESVCLSLNGLTPQLECRNADSDGKVTFTFIVPTGLQTGNHTVYLTGAQSGPVDVEFDVLPIIKTGGTSQTSQGASLFSLMMVSSIMMFAGIWILPRVRRASKERVFS